MPIIVDVSEEDVEKQKEGGGLSKNTKKMRTSMLKSVNEYFTSRVSFQKNNRIFQT